MLLPIDENRDVNSKLKVEGLDKWMGVCMQSYLVLFIVQ